MKQHAVWLATRYVYVYNAQLLSQTDIKCSSLGNNEPGLTNLRRMLLTDYPRSYHYSTAELDMHAK